MPKTFLNLPHGLEVLIIKASVDPEFKTLLLERRAEAAGEIGLTLTPVETAMLAAIPTATLETTIAQTQVLPETRRVFLGKVAAAMLAALGVGSGSTLQPWAMAPLGHGSDIPSPLIGKEDLPTTHTYFAPLDEKDLNAALAEIDQTSHTANTATSHTQAGASEGTNPKPATRQQPIPRLEPIYFERGQAVIRDDQQPKLQRNLEILKSQAVAGQWILLIGHTDTSGTPEHNFVMGAQRATAVRDALVQGGIPAERIRIFSMGEKQPVKARGGQSAAVRSRRVEFKVAADLKAEDGITSESELIDLRTMVNFPKPLFSAGHSLQRPNWNNPPDVLRDGWDLSPNSKRP